MGPSALSLFYYCFASSPSPSSPPLFSCSPLSHSSLCPLRSSLHMAPLAPYPAACAHGPPSHASSSTHTHTLRSLFPELFRQETSTAPPPQTRPPTSNPPPHLKPAPLGGPGAGGGAGAAAGGGAQRVRRAAAHPLQGDGAGRA